MRFIVHRNKTKGDCGNFTELGNYTMKRILTMVLSLAMALSLCATAFADAPVARIEGKGDYNTLSEAISAAVSGDTIELLADVTETDAENAGIVYDLTGKILDLGGFTYTHNNFAHVFQGTGGKITNGKMVCAGGGSYALFVGDTGDTTSFVVEKLELTGGINIYNATGVVLRNVTVNGADYYAIWMDEASAATIESGTYTAGKGAVFGATTDSDNGEKSVLTVAGGTINAKGKPLMLDDGGTLNVKGGTFENLGDTIKTDGNGIISITGGTFKDGNGSKADVSQYLESGKQQNADGSVGNIPRYYYNSTTTTDTKADGTKGSPKTFDAGVGIYALTAVLSVTGMACVGKKKF